MASAFMSDSVGMRVMSRTVKAHAPATSRITDQAAAAAAVTTATAAAVNPVAAALTPQQQHDSGITGSSSSSSSSNIRLPGPDPPGLGGVLPSPHLAEGAAHLEDSAPAVAVEPSSLCGAPKLVATAKRTTCRIRSYWLSREGRIDNISTCSGFKLLPDVLGTAGHCIYNKVTTECSGDACMYIYVMKEWFAEGQLGL
jgi:hypothetical protein